jgi:hypothetical protein
MRHNGDAARAQHGFPLHALRPPDPKPEPKLASSQDCSLAPGAGALRTALRGNAFEVEAALRKKLAWAPPREQLILGIGISVPAE